MGSVSKRVETCANILDVVEPAWQLKIDREKVNHATLLAEIFGSSGEGLRRLETHYPKHRGKPKKLRRSLGLEPNAERGEHRIAEVESIHEAWKHEVTARLKRIA